MQFAFGEAVWHFRTNHVAITQHGNEVYLCDEKKICYASSRHMDRFVTRQKRDDAEECEPLTQLLQQCDYRRAVSMHPAHPHLGDAVRSAFLDLQRVQLAQSGTLVECMDRLRGNRGSLVGTLFEFFLVHHLATYGFRGQQLKHEPDVVHALGRSELNFEVKTTSTSTEDVFGNRIASNDIHKAGSFLLAVSYDLPTLSVRRIRFGWVQPADWVAQHGNGQQSKLSESARARLVSVQ